MNFKPDELAGTTTDALQLFLNELRKYPLLSKDEEIELAARFLRGRLLAITGSNGKTTTTLLTGHILREAGRRVLVGGNVGTPLISLAEQSDEETLTVAEVSSFQLEAVADHFRPAPIEQFGHRAPTWYLLRHLNDQIRELAPWLIKLHSTGVYHSAPLPKVAKPVADSRLVKQILAATYQSPPVPAEYLIGEFKDAEGHSFLMIVNKSLNYSIRYVIRLKQPKEHLVEISPYTGKELPVGVGVSWLAPGGGTLFEVK